MIVTQSNCEQVFIYAFFRSLTYYSNPNVVGTLHLTNQENKAVIVISLEVIKNGIFESSFNLTDALITKITLLNQKYVKTSYTL